MVTSIIGILLLIKNSKTEFPGVSHPWYVDDTLTLDMISRVKKYFHSLELRDLR